MSDIDRKTSIADAALRLIGAQGARGLTHRGVDKEAALPLGSTSYYCRRRVDLLMLALRRHAELDHQDLVTNQRLIPMPLTADAVAGIVTDQIVRWTREQNRARLTARFELFLAASREPALISIVQEQRDRFLGTMEIALRMLNIAHPRARAASVIAMIEGLLLEQLRAESLPIKPADLRSTLLAILTVRTPDC